jgi:hypothetical protein
MYPVVEMRIRRRESVKPPKGSPVPTRFELAEDEFLAAAGSATGLPISEVIRRSVRLARRQKELLNDSYQFMLDLK